MTTLKKRNWKSQGIHWFIFLMLFQSCQAQDKNGEKDIETIQKNAISVPQQVVSYTDNVDFKLAAKIATPGVVNIKCTFGQKSQPYDGKLKRNTDIREGFVITAVNNKMVTTVQSFINAVELQKGGIMLEGKYAGDSIVYYYAFGL